MTEKEHPFFTGGNAQLNETIEGDNPIPAPKRRNPIDKKDTPRISGNGGVYYDKKEESDE